MDSIVPAFLSASTPMQWAYLALLGALVALLYRMVRDPAYRNFRCVHMVSNKRGYPDNIKIFELGAFITSTYAFVWMLWDKSLQEAFYIAYLTVWAARGAYSMKKKTESARGGG